MSAPIKTVMGVWDQRLAPVRATSFVVAGAVEFRAMSGNRMAASRDVGSADDAGRIAQKFDEIFDRCPPHQIGCAAVASMGV